MSGDPERNGASQNSSTDHHPDTEPYDDPAPTIVGDPDAYTPRPDPAPLCDLTGFGRDCLVAVGRIGETTAPEVQRVLTPHYPGEIHNGRLYPALATLVDKGLVNKDSNTNPHRYAISNRGLRELDAHLRWVREGPEEWG